MIGALLGNGKVNTLDTRLQQWNEVMQPASRRRLGKQTFTE
jgi:hypothetical protein